MYVLQKSLKKPISRWARVLKSFQSLQDDLQEINLLLRKAWRKKMILIIFCWTLLPKIKSSLEMGSSWNFPAQASPSYESSEPSRAGALHFSSWNRAEIFLRTTIKFPNFLSSIMIITNSNQLHDNFYEFMTKVF